jgi:hypothetical protein
MRVADAAIIDKRQALAFEIFEVEHRTAVTLGNITARDAVLAQTLRPKRECILAADAQAGAHYGIGAAPLAPDRPIEEGEIGAGARETVGEEEMIGRDVVL